MAGSGYRDYFKVLGVERSADADAIKRAFRKLARQYHPDVNPGDANAEAKFKEVSEAYEVLSDPDKRRRYEQFGQYWIRPELLVLERVPEGLMLILAATATSTISSMTCWVVSAALVMQALEALQADSPAVVSLVVAFLGEVLPAVVVSPEGPRGLL